MAKNADVGTYRIATGFEALMGYLYLSGQQTYRKADPRLYQLPPLLCGESANITKIDKETKKAFLKMETIT